jgi:hypothetical protein
VRRTLYNTDGGGENGETVFLVYVSKEQRTQYIERMKSMGIFEVALIGTSSES